MHINIYQDLRRIKFLSLGYIGICIIHIYISIYIYLFRPKVSNASCCLLWMKAFRPRHAGVRLRHASRPNGDAHCHGTGEERTLWIHSTVAGLQPPAVSAALPEGTPPLPQTATQPHPTQPATQPLWAVVLPLERQASTTGLPNHRTRSPQFLL